MEKEKATLYDYARMCRAHKDCKFCLLSYGVNKMGVMCWDMIRDYPDKANEIILKWCEEHPIKTRQSEFLEMFPNADIYKGAINICPGTIDCDYDCKNKEKYVDFDCTGCKKGYWLAEVEENDK